jgi:hypothetical protein
MRTILDIDEDVLEAAEELAEREGKTAGQVISELVRKGVLCTNTHANEAEDAPFVIKDGIPVFRYRRGRLVTNALVKRIQEELDEEEVRRANGLE